MGQRAYVLIDAEIGTSDAILTALHSFSAPEVRIRAADTVTGPCDVIVELEGTDLDYLGEALGKLQKIPGVRRTTTCLCVNFG